MGLCDVVGAEGAEVERSQGGGGDVEECGIFEHLVAELEDVQLRSVERQVRTQEGVFRVCLLGNSSEDSRGTLLLLLQEVLRVDEEPDRQFL